MRSAEPTRPTRVTTADVAKLAGVSRATVSFVLNDTAPGRVSDATRAKVRAAADQLGYVGHAAARSLRAGRSDLVVLPAAEAAIGGLMSAWLSSIQRALATYGYTVVLHGGPETEPVAAARAWAELRPAAVFAMQGERLTPDARDLLRRAGVGAVFAVAAAPVPGVHTLLIDQAESGALAVQHLADRGRRRIAVVMPTEPGLDAFAEPRLAGARRAARPHGVEITPAPLSYRVEDAARLAAEWRWDGVFGYNDDYAALLMRALLDQGIQVPSEVGVVGADDLMIAEVVRPRLTSVHFEWMPADQIAELVHRQVTDPQPPTGITGWARMSLVARDSS